VRTSALEQTGGNQFSIKQNYIVTSNFKFIYMKKAIVLLVLSTLFYSSQAQTSTGGGNPSGYKQVMLSTIGQFDTASAAGTLMTLANTFERIGNAEQGQWQPFYYASLCYVVMAYNAEDKSKIDVLADKAEGLLIKAKALQENNSEISCLFAMISSCRLLVDPVSRFREKGPEVHHLLSKAKQENPDNPRIYLLQARMELNTPEAFGGGKHLARKSIETCIEKFSIFKPESPIDPNWGAHQARSFLANMNTGL
jgi:hypothetical protein